MKYTREQIEFHVDDRPPSIGDDLYAWASDAEYIIRQLLAENDALREDAERWKVADACSAVVSDSGGGFVYQILIPFQGNLWRREGNQNDFFREDIDAARKKG